MKDQHLRARLPADEYQALKIAADRAGMTVSEHVRCVIARDSLASRQDQFLTRLDARLASVLRPPEADPKADPETENSTNAVLEPLVVELLFLVRELVAERNAQVLGRVGQQLNNLYPERKKV